MAEGIPRIALGRTGLQVTRLGIGGAYCRTVEGYRAALDCGVNYLDTAHDYLNGEDEQLIGHAIAGRRHKLVLATKTQRRDAAGARAELEQSLRSLRTDYIDIWQIHYLNTEAERAQVLGPGGTMEAAVRAREQGLVRFIGVTGHDWAEVGKAVATGLFDTVLCWYNCAMKEPESLIFPHAVAQGTGVIIMSAARQEKLFSAEDDPPMVDFYRYVLSHPAVHVTLMALRSEERFCRVARGIAERPTLTAEEQRRLEAYGSAMRTAGLLEL